MAKRLTKNDILGLLQICAPALERHGLQYCLAEGILKDLHQNGGISRLHSDLDLHILHDDKPLLNTVTSDLKSDFPEYNLNTNASYKTTFTKDRPGKAPLIIEFMFIFVDDGESYFRHNNDKYYVSETCVTNTQETQLGGLQVKLPEDVEGYLKEAYPNK